MNIKPRIENEIAHGEYVAEKGEEVWNWSSPAGHLRWQRRVDMFREFLGSSLNYEEGGGNKKVLEIGCGTGLFTEQLALTEHQIVAIDISSTLLNLAKKRINRSNVVFEKEDAHKTSFGNDSFDFIVGSSALHHLDSGAALKEFFRILKPGGKIMFTEPNMLNPQIAVQKNIPFIKKLAGDSPDEKAFIKWSLKKILAGNGFIDIFIENFDFLHPAIPKFLLSYAGRLCVMMEYIPVLKEISGSLVIKAGKP